METNERVWGKKKRSPAQVGYMRQVLGPGALGRPRGIGWRGRWERGSGWGIHVNPWLIHVNVWQKPLQYCKVISLQLIKKKKEKVNSNSFKMSGRITILNVFWINQWIIDDCHKTNGEDYKNCSPGSFWLYIYFKKLTVNHIRKYPQIPYWDSFCIIS